MSISDPIADLCTRIRNAAMQKHQMVTVPASQMKQHIVQVLKDEGFIESWQVEEDKPFSHLNIYLKYDRKGESVIRSIHRISKPGRRIHAKVSDINPILNGQGIAIVTTSKGVLSDRECRAKKIGGEILCHVW